jgi:hypothetical protein
MVSNAITVLSRRDNPIADFTLLYFNLLYFTLLYGHAGSAFGRSGQSSVRSHIITANAKRIRKFMNKSDTVTYCVRGKSVRLRNDRSKSQWDQRVGRGSRKGSVHPSDRHYFPEAILKSSLSHFLCRWRLLLTYNERLFSFYPQASDVGKAHNLVPGTALVLCILKSASYPYHPERFVLWYFSLFVSRNGCFSQTKLIRFRWQPY